jgi:N-acetylmuramoyl-L-alanine amidase
MRRAGWQVSSVNGLPLGLGAVGEAVRDLQQRLGALDLGDAAIQDQPGAFGPDTERAVRRFQQLFGLDVDGVVGDLTWAVLVEASYRLGDRQLYHRSPMMRGDDIAELQRKLGSLGFDAGRADGIFGPATARALAEFQRNVGLSSDGIFGPDTLAALQRLGQQRTAALTVAHVRERERLRSAPRQLCGRRVAIGHPGGLGALVQAVHRLLRELDAHVIALHHPDGSQQAQHANNYDADVFVGLRLASSPTNRAAFFRGASFESLPGRRLAELVTRTVEPVLGMPAGDVSGMRLPILRETRMPAVVAEIGPAGAVVLRTEQLARALVQALAAWVQEPIPAPSAAGQPS